MTNYYDPNIRKPPTVRLTIDVEYNGKYDLTFGAFLNNKYSGYCFLKVDTLSVSTRKMVNRLYAESKLGEYGIIIAYYHGQTPPVKASISRARDAIFYRGAYPGEYGISLYFTYRNPLELKPSVKASISRT